jgi:uncharacterized protein
MFLWENSSDPFFCRTAVLLTGLVGSTLFAPRALAEVPDRAPVRNSAHQFEIFPRTYIEIRNQNIVMQRRDYSCGAACLATLARYYWGDDVTEDMVLVALDQILTPEEIQDRIKNGLAMTDLRKAAVKLGYSAVVGKLTFSKLQEAKVPVLVGISPEGHDHFVVYRGFDGNWVYVADPIRGNIRIPVWQFLHEWQENAVLAIHKPGEKVREVSPLSLRWDEVMRGETTWQWIRNLDYQQTKRDTQVP